MKFTKSVQIDISCTTPKQIIKEKQLDNGTRTIYANFFNALSNTDISFTGEEKFEFRIRRADGVLVTSEGEYDNGQIKVTLSAEMLGCPGRAQADIRAMNGDEILSGGSFAIDVESVAEGSHSTGMSGDAANIRKLSREAYNALEVKSGNTIYLVEDDGVTTMYLGDTMIAALNSQEDVNINGHKLILYNNLNRLTELISSLSADSDGDVSLSREFFLNGSLVRAAALSLYEDDETQEQVAELSADDKIRLIAGANVFEVSDEGVLFNGKKLGGGGASAGQTVGILAGSAASVYGIAEEVNE